MTQLLTKRLGFAKIKLAMNKKFIAIFLILAFLIYILPNQVRAVDLIKGTGPEVFLLKFEKRHWIKSPEVFSSLGFKWQDIIELSDEELHQYALGIIIASSSDLNKLNQEKIGGEVEKTITESKEPIIRIGIYGMQNGELFQITANGPYEIYKNNEFLNIKNKEEIFEIIINHQNVFKFIPKTQNTVFKINGHELRGEIELKYSPQSRLVWAINELSIEDYLKGIAEIANTYPSETLKSLVIAARSYALFHIQNNGKYPGEIFHLRDWAYDQVYKGYKFESEAPNLSEAVEQTKGIVATFNNKPILGVFSADSGGLTKNACEIWANNFCEENYNYLRGGIKDPTGTKHVFATTEINHGVGISATGAEKLAELGKTYQEILKYYYQGIEIKKIY
jgi:peptidoglycan hydrolase-like amidase